MEDSSHMVMAANMELVIILTSRATTTKDNKTTGHHITTNIRCQWVKSSCELFIKHQSELTTFINIWTQFRCPYKRE